MQDQALKPVIDEESCIGCGVCAENCPIDAIRIENKAKINRVKCTGCGKCARVCPQNAIRLIPTKSLEFRSPGERLKALRKRAENLGKRLNEVENLLRKLIESSNC